MAMTHTAMSDKHDTISYLQWHTYSEISNFSCELFLLQMTVKRQHAFIYNILGFHTLG